MNITRYNYIFIAFLTLLGANHCVSQSLSYYKTLKDTTYRVEKLGYDKHLQITVPKDFQSKLPQTFPLIVIFDMQNQSNYDYMLKSIDYMTLNSQMPASVIIGIEAGKDAKRIWETLIDTNNVKALGNKNEEYIFDELIPLARQQFRASSFTLLIGHSRYGYFTTYLLAKHPKELSAVISLSPYFVDQPNPDSTKNFDVLKLLKREIAATRLNHTLYYRLAEGNDYPKGAYKQLDEAVIRGQFANSRFDAAGWYLPQTTHIAVPGLTVTRALYDVFSYWLSCQNGYLYDKKQLTAADIIKSQSDVKSHYGTPLAFSLGVLNGKGWEFYNEKDYVTAILAWKQLVKNYPNFPEGYLNLARCQKRLNLKSDDYRKLFKESLDQSVYLNETQKAALLKEADEL